LKDACEESLLSDINCKNVLDRLQGAIIVSFDKSSASGLGSSIVLFSRLGKFGVGIFCYTGSCWKQVFSFKDHVMVGFLQIIEQSRVNDSIFLEWTGRSFNQVFSLDSLQEHLLVILALERRSESFAVLMQVLHSLIFISYFASSTYPIT